MLWSGVGVAACGERNLGRLKGVDFLWDAKRNPNLATAASRRSAVSLSFVELNCVSTTANRFSPLGEQMYTRLLSCCLMV